MRQHRRYLPQVSDYPEIPFTSIQVQGTKEDPLVRPMYGDGTLGEPDATLLARIEAKEFGDYHHVGGFGGSYMIIPFWGAPKTTPFGPTEYPSRRGVMADYDPVAKRMTDAALAEQRRLSHGHWGFYDTAEVRGLIHNEGVEYGLTSYTDVHNFQEPERTLALTAITAIEARDQYEHELGQKLEDGEITEDEFTNDPGLAELAGRAEAAKRAFCRHLGIDNEPWEGPE